jgi:hypothetical protein
MAHRENGLHEVAFQLNMHSISFRTEPLPVLDYATNDPAFPPFPRINPGSIPSEA